MPHSSGRRPLLRGAGKSDGTSGQKITSSSEESICCVRGHSLGSTDGHMITLSCGEMCLTVCMCLSVMLLVYMCIFTLTKVERNLTTSLSVISITRSYSYCPFLKEVVFIIVFIGWSRYYDILWSIYTVLL